MYLFMSRIKATFTIDKEVWKKFKVSVTSSEKKYSHILEELIKDYLKEKKRL